MLFRSSRQLPTQPQPQQGRPQSKLSIGGQASEPTPSKGRPPVSRQQKEEVEPEDKPVASKSRTKGGVRTPFDDVSNEDLGRKLGEGLMEMIQSWAPYVPRLENLVEEAVAKNPQKKDSIIAEAMEYNEDVNPTHPFYFVVCLTFLFSTMGLR